MPELVLIRMRHDVLPERLALLRAGRSFPVAMTALAFAAHAALAYSLSRAPRAVPVAVAPEPIELAPTEPPVPPPPPPPVPEPAPLPERAPPPTAESPPAPAPAAAAQALTQTAEPEQPVDFSDELVTGSAAAYRGGTTVAGPAKPAAAAVVRAGSAANGSGSAPSRAVGAEDRSRAASVLGGLDWRCPFPDEADVAGVDRALAKISVELDAGGRVRNVSVLSDPGNGFGRAAERCARGKRFSPALDRDGRAVSTRVTVGVRFVR